MSNDDNSEDKADDDGGENGPEHQQPPKPVGFWHPSLKAVRFEAMRKWVYTSMFGFGCADCNTLTTISCCSDGFYPRRSFAV